MNQGRVIELLKKLQALASNNNSKEEAILAAERMQDLLTKYNISIAELDDNGLEIKTFVLCRWKKRFQKWKISLATNIADANDCIAIVHQYDVNLAIAGNPAKFSTIQYMFNYLVREIDKLTDYYMKERKDKGLKSTKTTSNSFRRGCVDEIGARMLEKKEEIMYGASTKALVYIGNEKRAVDDYVDENTRSGSYDVSGGQRDRRAYIAGVIAAQEIELDESNRAISGGKNHE